MADVLIYLDCFSTFPDSQTLDTVKYVRDLLHGFDHQCLISNMWFLCDILRFSEHLNNVHYIRDFLLYLTSTVNFYTISIGNVRCLYFCILVWDFQIFTTSQRCSIYWEFLIYLIRSLQLYMVSIEMHMYLHFVLLFSNSHIFTISRCCSIE